MALLAAALQTIAAFDLACAGTLRTGPLGLALPEESGTPFAIAYHVDLDANRWCSDACATTEAIATIAREAIVLREIHAANGSHVITFFPAEARFTDTLIEGNVATLRSGTCQIQSFTGFPVAIA